MVLPERMGAGYIFAFVELIPQMMSGPARLAAVLYTGPVSVFQAGQVMVP
jgi:hypothetical protein